jgi:hypothetical protein
MPQRRGQPLKWSPKGLSDTLDTSEIFEGAMALLQNLVPDPTTDNVWQCRPAALQLADFGATSILVRGSTNSGSGYVNGTYNNVPLSGGSGSGAQANFVVSLGFVSQVNLINGGKGYKLSDVLGVNNTFLGGTGSGFSMAISALGYGIINTIGTLVGGAGYTNGAYTNVPLIPILGPAPMVPALANITVAGGAVTVCTLVSGGIGYLSDNEALTAPTSIIGAGTGFSIQVATLVGAQTFGQISVLLNVGNYVYGMIAAPIGVYAGHDIPFAYNLVANSFTSISGITAANTPTSLGAWTPPATPTAWTPPCMALVGSKIIVTHLGFSMVSGPVGQIDITNPSAPAWSTFNLTGTAAQPFTVVPSWVQQFNGRAYYIHNLTAQPAVFFSDSLAPSTMTNANQILTFNDQMQLTAMGPLQLNNQLGGIVQSLMVFKGVANIYQITGDYALNSLAINALNVATGTLAPNSITATPKGLAFMAPDGYRVIDFQATVSDPIGQEGSGITVPFINAVVPSRVSASCNGSVFRTTVQNGIKPGAPIEEYWFYFGRSWNGPQLFPITSAQFTAPSLATEYNNTFIVAYAGMPGSLWQSDYVQSLLSTFVENGFQMQWTWQTPQLPSAEQIGNIAMTETSIMLAFGVGTTAFGISAISPSGTGITGTSLTSQASASLWGSFIWGTGIWGSQVFGLSDRQVPWPIPIVSTRFTIQLNGNSAQNVKIGAMRLRYQPLSQYLTPAAGVL